MFSILQPAARRNNDVAEGFGSSTKVETGNPESVSSLSQPSRPLKIPGGASRHGVTQMLAPIFSAQRFLPVSLMGNLTIELELDNYDACFARDNERYPYAWEIVQPLILVDSVQLDPALSSSYAKHLLEGKTLPISYHNFFSFQATLTDANAFSLPIQRGFSRLSAIYVTLFQNGTTFVADFSSPNPDAGFPDRNTDTFRCSLQLGGDLKPVYQTDSVGELYYRLRMCQSIHTGTDSMSIEFNNYYYGKQFVIGFTLEKVLQNEAAHTGVSTMGGQLLYLHLRNMQGIRANNATVHVVCHYDCVLTVTAGGCELAY
jgi:hypothetical protein